MINETCDNSGYDDCYWRWRR